MGVVGCDAQVDIIISEWMGYFLLYESMLDTVRTTTMTHTHTHRLMPQAESLSHR